MSFCVSSCGNLKAPPQFRTWELVGETSWDLVSAYDSAVLSMT